MELFTKVHSVYKKSGQTTEASLSMAHRPKDVRERESLNLETERALWKGPSDKRGAAGECSHSGVTLQEVS